VTAAQERRGVERFFAYARARHECYLMKQSDPAWETKDKILWKYRFTNVFRDLDKTSAWFVKHVRGPMHMSRDPNIMLATALFRLTNRIETGEAIFCDDDLLGGHSAFDEYVRTGKTAPLLKSIKKRMGNRGPYVTGGYIISSPPGYSKLEGMLRVVDDFRKQKRTVIGGAEWPDWDDQELGWQAMSEYLVKANRSIRLEQVHAWMRQFNYFGPFHAYEIVTDLRHTYLLNKAPDILTWANPGPGCRRGANRVFGRDYESKDADREQLIYEMRQLLQLSRLKEFWPHDKDHPRWEMRDVEHTLCELDKYERVRLGQGRPRGVYR
jgi:hypothetical protein